MISDESLKDDSTNAQRRERLLKLVRRMVNEALTPKQRELVVQYYFEQRTMPEIAEALGVNKSTVSRGIARALARINAQMQYMNIR